MDYFNFALTYFSILAGLLFLATAFAQLTGSFFGLSRDKLLHVALSFGATHAVLMTASNFVPPTQPVMTALLTLAIGFMSMSLIIRKAKTGHANFLWLVGNIFAVSGVSFEAMQHLSAANGAQFLPIILILTTSIIIARTAYSLPPANAPKAL